ncbi:RDD family protein [Calothrix sp. PCC 7507]|uniref:protein kinase domain-containing protein n=1 Tax=Calothrix sp. PCC 7507 TaxID=99598 RepID=UPI00029F29F7|nr:RDD family protein [Calothrix sp. PCC 7507]AFY35042.1 serine/threonine protein kinase [Calothrix sp. PCC 7507]
MSLCISPLCSKPQNPDNILFCQACGSELLLEGRYRVIHTLGEGGFGKTYEVSEARNNIPKVLKVLINNQQKAVELFQREAEVLSFLNHPGIPKVETNAYFVYFPRNRPEPLHCLVMEKIEGLDLQEYIRQRENRPIDQKLAVQWLSEIVNILQQVHSQNFFHRDIKPSNIMLRAEGGLALIDFGTARQVSGTYMAKQPQGQVTGIISVGYTPQEQLNGQAVPQSDFFALGRTFVYLLTGKEPNHSAIYDSYTDELRWRNYAPHISPPLADLIDQMMARFAGQRPTNTQEILQRLSAIDRPEIKQPPEPPVIDPPPPPDYEYAGFWRRLVADLIDQVILIFSSAIIASGSVNEVSSSSADQDALVGSLFIFIYIFVAAGYGPGLESSLLQATIGKKMMGIIVTNLNGNKISFGQAFARHISKFISYLTLGVGYIMVGFTQKRQTLHDQIAGCLVVKKR